MQLEQRRSRDWGSELGERRGKESLVEVSQEEVAKYKILWSLP